MAKKKVEILCILDRSGSMMSIIDETVAALNEFISQQKKLKGKATLTLVAFDNEYLVVHDRVDIKKVDPVSVSDVQPRGMTALNDAIGKTINSTKAKDVVLLIQTDGQENASQEYTTAQIKELVQAKEKEGWDISFIGAGIDAFSSGANYGLAANKCLSIDKTKEGMSQMRNYTCSVTTSYRAN
jgi:uncharacterized protein YegL